MPSGHQNFDEIAVLRVHANARSGKCEAMLYPPFDVKDRYGDSRQSWNALPAAQRITLTAEPRQFAIEGRTIEGNFSRGDLEQILEFVLGHMRHQNSAARSQ